MILTTGAAIFQRRRNINLMGDESNLPILICLLGRFRLLRAGQPIGLRNASKTKTLLSALALQPNSSVPRETLLQLLWPDTDQNLAGQSLNSLVYNLRNLLRDGLDDEPPVLCTDGYYRLNVDAGVAVDVAWFELLIDVGQQQERAGDPVAAVESIAATCASTTICRR
jgi:DNA-binding SARP family transcriptional activator